MSEPLLRLKNIEKSYLKKKPVFSDIQMEISRGEFLFLTGISGAGKSTMFKLILGLERPDKGDVVFQGKEVHSMGPAEMSLHRRSIGVVFQDYKLLPNKTAAENIAIPLKIAGVSSFRIEARVKQAGKRHGITALLNQPIKSLSGGEQQLVAVTRASIHSPKLILADEPTANLDQKMASRIINLLLDLNQGGTTVIIATHDINLIKAHKKRILLIKNAKLTEVY